MLLFGRCRRNDPSRQPPAFASLKKILGAIDVKKTFWIMSRTLGALCMVYGGGWVRRLFRTRPEPRRVRIAAPRNALWSITSL